jgi:hypothetical protein
VLDDVRERLLHEPVDGRFELGVQTAVAGGEISEGQLIDDVQAGVAAPV